MHNLSITYLDLERHEDALVLQEKVLEILRRIFSGDHPDTSEFVGL
jgi:hypothetical protein